MRGGSFRGAFFAQPDDNWFKRRAMTLVLLIDDDPLIAEVVTACMPEYTVGCLTDGTRAVQVIETKHPALVILDCSMPIVPGMEVLRAIRSSQKCCSVPVLMLTARASAVDREIALRSGATDYLAKPFDPDELAAIVDAMIRGDRARHERVRTNGAASRW